MMVLDNTHRWIPAYAGMTAREGMTVREGMTARKKMYH